MKGVDHLQELNLGEGIILKWMISDLPVKLTGFLRISKKKLHGLSPRANYTDRATADCRRSNCQHLADRGCHVVSVTDPYCRILGFVDRSRYFSIK
jgi:hypothetical protein